MKRIVVFISFLCGIFFLHSCQESSVLDETKSFGEVGWASNNKILMPVEIKNDSIDYQLFVAIRQSNEYPFHNFYFATKILDTTGKTIKQGLAQAYFYNPKTGKSTGSGSGFIYSHKYLIFKELTFPKSGKYIVQLEQYMRKDTLTGILSVGASISPQLD
jgi:gliding motility-associated lipoprotein GldH